MFPIIWCVCTTGKSLSRKRQTLKGKNISNVDRRLALDWKLIRVERENG